MTMVDARGRGPWRLGVDIGGTFTDIVLAFPDGEVLLWKEDTTHGELELGVKRGVESLAQSLGLSMQQLLAGASLFVHGSTVATNAVIERRGTAVGLLTTAGFRDSLYFRDGYKWERFNPRLERPLDFVERYRRLGVRERVDRNGTVLTALDDGSVAELAADLKARSVEAVAVSLLWSHANPTHERRLKELLEREMPGVPVMLSSDILPEIGEWVRTSATVLSAYVYPAAATYLRRLETWLRESGLERPLLIMQVNGGCATVDAALRVPVALLASGPAAAPTAGRHVGRLAGSSDVITIDMGGTSLDVSVISSGAIPRSRNMMVEHQPIGVPGVELHSIGAGGGSIAWIDSGGAMRVGPESAGSTPGPAAYARGGTRPTVTDANVILGYLSPGAFLGGRRTLDVEAARAAMEEHIAQPLGIDIGTAAAGVIRVVNAAMVSAIRSVSVERGIDPRPFLMIAGGGAGALHAGRLAQQLGMRRIMVPREAGTLSAFGMTVADVRHDYQATLHTNSATPRLDEVAAAIAELEDRARADLRRSGFADEQIRLERSVDARYEGQVNELITPVPAGDVDHQTLAAVAEAFHALHEERYTYALAGRPIEYLHWRVSGVGVLERESSGSTFPTVTSDAGQPSATGHRSAYFEESGAYVDTPTYDAAAFGPGQSLVGPALIDSATTTVVVLPAQRLVADGRGSFLLEFGVDPVAVGSLVDGTHGEAA
jgi:N-methylhydantoinase A